MAFVAAGLVVSHVIVLNALRSTLIDRVDNQLGPLATIYSLAPVQSDDTIQQYLRLDLIGGKPFMAGNWRLLAVPRRAVPSGTVVVAVTLDPVNATVDRLTLVCALTGVGVLTVLLVAGWFAVRRGLRPLRDIERTAVAIAGVDHSRRVPVDADEHTEIGRLSGALNGMLAQLETSLAARSESEPRMRRFVADASHELRPPAPGRSGPDPAGHAHRTRRDRRTGAGPGDRRRGPAPAGRLQPRRERGRAHAARYAGPDRCRHSGPAAWCGRWLRTPGPH
jgi:signal transduction histidine kinase